MDRGTSIIVCCCVCRVLPPAMQLQLSTLIITMSIDVVRASRVEGGIFILISEAARFWPWLMAIFCLIDPQTAAWELRSNGLGNAFFPRDADLQAILNWLGTPAGRRLHSPRWLFLIPPESTPLFHSEVEFCNRAQWIWKISASPQVPVRCWHLLQAQFSTHNGSVLVLSPAMRATGAA